MRTLVDLPKYLEPLSLALGEEAVFIDQIELEGLVIELAGAVSDRLLEFSEAGFLAHPLLVVAIFPRFTLCVAQMRGIAGDGLSCPAAWKAQGFNLTALALESLLQAASQGVVEWSGTVFEQSGGCPIEALEALTAASGTADQMMTRLRFQSAGLRSVAAE